MRSEPPGIVLRQIRTLWDEGRVGAISDEELLERFAGRHGGPDEIAFEALILRHGPMVLGVCRRVLRDPHEAEDAFQATFLILARQAGSIRKGEVLGGWLCRVAYRVAARSRALAVRRGAIEQPGLIPSGAAPPDQLAERDDLCAAILAEVQLLPEKYRLPVQLCYLEGQTHDEAARQLAWPVGTVRTRLGWARDRLRVSLARRGLALSAGLLGTALISLKATAQVPAPLVEATVAAAVGRASGTAAATLAAGVLRAMLMLKLKLAVVVIVAAGSLAGAALPFARARVGRANPVVAAPAGRGQEPATAREVRTVFFRVVDREAKQPVPGVTLKVWIDGKMARQQVTDESGRMVIALPEKEPERLTITARKDGLVPMRVYLRHFAAKETEIPRSYTLAMERGTSIGGIVRDEEGRPIEGVAVSLYEDGPEDRGREALDFDGITARTDAQGRWHLDFIPAGLDLGHLHFTFAHPDFVSWIDASNNQSILSPEQLRSRSGVVVLRKGLPVTGRVLDRDGRPIAGASVRLGDPFRHVTAWVTTIKTDAKGRFRIGNTALREAPLSVQAAGYAPELVPVKVQPDLPPVEFRLGPGRTIRGRVIDDRGRPVPGATVAASQWRGHQTLDWRVETDAEGRFRWDDAPSDAVSLVVFKAGYDGMTRIAEPTGQDLVLSIVPSRELRIRGTVTDAETGRPIETFTVVPGTEIGGPTLWTVEFAKVRHGGRYEFSFSEMGTQPHRARIEAMGYLPAISPAYPHNAGEKVFDVRLVKGEWVAGVVHGTDGRPLAGAEVVVATAPGLDIDGGKSYQRIYHPHLVTGPDGRFAFSPPDGPYRIVALHELGYAEATGERLAESREMVIEPWGRVEGTLRVAGQPRPNETVIASVNDEPIEHQGPGVHYQSRAQTDANGRFVIERVTPGDVCVQWQLRGQSAQIDQDRYYQPEFLDVRPGRTARVDLVQEGGRPLVGRVVRPDAVGQAFGPNDGNSFLIPKRPEVPYPPDLTERREWLARWRLTEAGRTYSHRRRGFGRSLRIQPDGSFRMNEVQPGEYELHVSVAGYAELVREVVVPKPAPGQDAGPVDLGALNLKRFGPPDAGR